MSTFLNRQPSRAAFAFIFTTVTLDMLALGIMIPVLPKLIIKFEGGNVANAATVSGLFAFVWAAMQFIFSPILGSLSDHYGRRPIILLSNLGMGFDYILMALAPTLPWLFLGRVISGITSAVYPIANAYIADVTPPEGRASKFGMLGAAFGLGFIVGPALGGILGGINLRLPFWVGAALSLANAAYGFFILPESLPKEERKKFSWGIAHPFGSLQFLRSYPTLTGFAWIAFLYSVAHEALPSVFVLYTNYRYSWDENKIGLALAVVGACTTIVSALLTGPVVARLGERYTLLVGLIFGIAGLMIYGFASQDFIFNLGTPLIALWSFTGPAMQVLLTRQVNSNEQGQLQGALNSLRGITGMIGPILFTQVFALAIRKENSFQLPGSPYLFASLLLTVSLLFAWKLTQSQ